MENTSFISIVIILLLGFCSQWVASKSRIPVILMLLLCGIIVGPVLNFISPDAIFGDLITPIVSASVAIILFEGGLNLRLSELGKNQWIVGRLILIGVPITWIGVSVSAKYLLDFSWHMSLLIGAIFVVTGPTVIIPLVRQLRLKRSVGAILKWEGIMNDPIGAFFAVIVYESMIGGHSLDDTTAVIKSILYTIIVGCFFGCVGAYVSYYVLKKNLLPDFLHNPFILSGVLTVFAASNILQSESGLLAATLMGVILTNIKGVRVKHITEFKENLSVLLISFLFVVLAARFSLDDLNNINLLNALIFLGILILIIRPISVYISCIQSNINWKEKHFLAALAPRGIVAAAIASVFSFSLIQNGIQEAEQLVPITFIIIIGTVTFYSLLAQPLAQKLKLASPNPNGILIIGASRWAIQIAYIFALHKIPVILADSNWQNISRCRALKLKTYYGNILSEYAIDQLPLDTIGYLFALTPNDEINTLSCIHYSDIVGRSNVYQIHPQRDSIMNNSINNNTIYAKYLFNDIDLNYHKLDDLIHGEHLYVMKITDKAILEGMQKKFSNVVIFLFVLTQDKRVNPYSMDGSPNVTVGDVVLLVLKKDVKEEIYQDVIKYAQLEKIELKYSNNDMVNISLE